MIKRYEPYQHGSWFEAKKYGEWVKHDDHLAECERRVAEEREKWQTEVQRLHASIEILDSLNPSERIRADERERIAAFYGDFDVVEMRGSDLAKEIRGMG